MNWPRLQVIRAARLSAALLTGGCAISGGDDLDLDGDGYVWSEDCANEDASVHPDAEESCDDVDNDCDGDIDEGLLSIWYLDADGDNYGDTTKALDSCPRPEGYAASGGDCDDDSALVNPAASEVCDDVDNDCDGDTDEDGALDAATWYHDGDGDGYGDDAVTVIGCDQTSGYTLEGGDCDDADAGASPGVDERCDGIDNDCDGDLDEPDATDASYWYADVDGDGWGDVEVVERACEAPSGYVAEAESGEWDCDDGDAAYNPGAAEDDCTDPNDYNCDSSVGYADADADGFAACEECDDLSAGVNPAATEICNDIDDDCDGDTDEPEASDASVWYVDIDGDGYGDASASQLACDQPSGYSADATDCDDGAAATWPGADEYCDEVDTDCDGDIDEDGALDASTWYADADGDGYGDDASPEISCEPPTGYAAAGGDCDESNAALNPGADEVCDASDVDEDCDGSADDDDPEGAADASTWYTDADSDGYGDASASQLACDRPSGHAERADDCDDSDATLYPEAPEICDDGVVNDCDGDVQEAILECISDGDLASAGAKLAGESSGDEAGWAVSDAGDVDGDGFDDLLISARSAGSSAGAVYLVSGPVSGDVDLSAADAKLTGESAGDQAGRAVSAAGDVDGDGFDDLLVGAPFADGGDSDRGVTYLFLGPVTGELSLSASDAEFVGEDDYDYAGWAVSGAGDVDDDSFDDLLISTVYDDAGGVDAGAVYLILGPATGDVDLSAADARLTGESDGDSLGQSVSDVGDADGDGFGDFLIGAHGESGGGSEAGAGYLLLGPVSGDVDLSAADARLTGESAGDKAGYAVSAAGDVDGDGLDDLLVGAPHEATNGADAGAAYLILSPAAGDLDLSAADAKLAGGSAGDVAGWSVSGAGDVDGDGFDDFLVGAPFAGGYAGAAHLMFGPITGDLDLSTADAVFPGESSSDYTGYSVSGAGDPDGDGFGDLLLGAKGEASKGANTGAIYLIFGGY